MEDKLQYLLAQALENSTEMVQLTDDQGTLMYINAAQEEISGYSCDEVIGKKANIFYSGAQSEDFYAELWRTITAGKTFTGHLENKRKDGRHYFEFKTITPLRIDSESITHFLSIARPVKNHQQHIDAQADYAYFDQLSGLPNRAYFHQRLDEALEHAQRTHQQLAVLSLDLNHFKKINDTLGHHTGDEVIRITARRLVNCLRKSDVCARMGGDEFAVLVTDFGESSMLSILATQIIRQISSPLGIDGNKLHVGCSVGIAVFPDDADDAATLLKRADIAMYDAKLNAIRHFGFYKENNGEYYEYLVRLEADIEQAIEQQQLQILYQPQIRLSDQGCSSVEAFIRWQHPELGAVYASEFVPILEKTGLARQVGAWSIQQVFQQLIKWHVQDNLKLHVSVNLSSHQLIQRDFVENLKALIGEEHSDLKSYLNIEITETMLVGDMLIAMEKLRDLDDMGINVALDDFGSGYSSLSQLNHGYIKILKIDRKYIQQIPAHKPSAMLVDSIIAMAHSLGMQVCAVGVENQQQLDYLKERKCDLVQGYMFSSAVSAGEVSQKLVFG